MFLIQTFFKLIFLLVLFSLETSVKTIEETFKEFTTKDDVAIVLISQYVSFLGCQNRIIDFNFCYFIFPWSMTVDYNLNQVANMIRFLVDSYKKPIPAILEIPSKDHPYDPAQDSILSRVKGMFSTESVASGRH